MMNTMPRRVTKMLMMSNTRRRSFRKILAKMTTQMGLPALIIFTSAMGMCFRLNNEDGLLLAKPKNVKLQDRWKSVCLHYFPG